jgi:hypothetical protein
MRAPGRLATSHTFSVDCDTVIGTQPVANTVDRDTVIGARLVADSTTNEGIYTTAAPESSELLAETLNFKNHAHLASRTTRRHLPRYFVDRLLRRSIARLYHKPAARAVSHAFDYHTSTRPQVLSPRMHGVRSS